MPSATWYKGEVGRNLEALRGHNGSLVLDLIRNRAGISRVELAAETELTPQGISKIVNRLIDLGMVAHSGYVSVGVGKPRTGLVVVPEARFASGVDLDRAGWRVVIVNLCGSVEAVIAKPFSRAPAPQDAVEVICKGATALLDELGDRSTRVVGCGVGIAGPLDHVNGIVTSPTNFSHWKNVRLASLLTEKLEMPVTLDKDTNMAALTECWRTGRMASVVVVYVGTGIGAGLVIDGRLYRGANTEAGEFGHMVLDVDGPLCACGRHGCVEAMCSPAAVVSRYVSKKVGGAWGGRRVAWGPRTEEDLRGIRGRAEKGEPAAVEALATAGRALGMGIGNVVRLLDCEEVIITGPLLDSLGQMYVKATREAFVASQRGSHRVVLSVSRSDASLIAVGSALLILGMIDV